MATEKQRLLQSHRRQKRMWLALTTLVFAVGMWFLPWWNAAGLALLAWLAHEAWYADHLFYSPGIDQHYRLSADWVIPLALYKGELTGHRHERSASTLILSLTVRASWFGRFLDPHIYIGKERFDFEPGAHGRRYLCLSGDSLTQPMSVSARHCSISGPCELSGMSHPDYSQQRIMVIAPHADDAELAAFGLYRSAREAMIVTVTQGEIEADKYAALGITSPAAARLKGRLRSWDSMVIPLWAEIPLENCVQLGYYCMQLSPMATQAARAFPSQASGETDTRIARIWNRIDLPSDHDGVPSWDNLVADLSFLIDRFRPDVVVTPHPQRDPHPDHKATTQAVAEATQRTAHVPATFLLYANHLHTTDRWPFGPAGGGVTLTPQLEPGPPESFWTLPTPPTIQLDKAMALAMEHDLQGSLPWKKRLRRHIQRYLTGRVWPATGDNEYFRKAIRSNELFTVRKSLHS